MRRVAQPPVDPAVRGTERTVFWPAALLMLAGMLFTVGAALRYTRIPTTEGGPASEVQLMGAFAHGGLERSRPEPPPDPRVLNDPRAFAQAMEQWQRQREEQHGLGFRVNPAAKDPCPT